MNNMIEKLMPYADQFGIKFDGNTVEFGDKYQPINTIMVNRICDIIDTPLEVQIVLSGCIYILKKESGELRIKILD